MSHPRVVKMGTLEAMGAVYIGRNRRGGSRWRNPFRIKEVGFRDCMAMYLDYLRDDPEGQAVVRDTRKLQGLMLVCWCAPGICHGDVLARLANGEELEVVRESVLAQIDRLHPPQGSLFE